MRKNGGYILNSGQIAMFIESELLSITLLYDVRKENEKEKHHILRKLFFIYRNIHFTIYTGD